jgi:hypothetical protein
MGDVEPLRINNCVPGLREKTYPKNMMLCQTANFSPKARGLYCPWSSNKKGAFGRVPQHMSQAYDSQDCAVFSEALNGAMTIYMRERRLIPQTLDIAAAALAYALFDAAATGERNPRRLAVAAAANVAGYETRLREQRSWTASSQDDIASHRAA